MKGTYVIYVNINREGWKKIYETPDRDKFEYALYKIYDYEEPTSVISKYHTKKGDYPLVSFYNRFPPNFSLQKVYRFLPKDE